MVPVIAEGGSSFRGAWLYYFHDKNATTSARVAWTYTRNLLTDCAEKAWKVMAFTANAQSRLKEAAGIARSGRKLEKPVFAYSLSWHPEQKPDKDMMLEAARLSLEALGLSQHETMIAAHRDEPHAHIHIVVNRCHPITGKAASISYSKRKLSDFAREWERREGKVYCRRREANYQKRQVRQSTRYVDPVIAEAWANSKDGRGFIAELEKHGYALAQGRKRLVVVDAYGKTANPVRHIKGVRAKAFNHRIKDVDRNQLPSTEEILALRKRSDAVSAKRTTHEEHLPEAIDRQMSRHHQEWANLSDHHRRLIEAEKHRLDQVYQLRDLDGRIDTLKAKLQSRNPLARFARKVFRLDRRIASKIEAVIATKENARLRFDEAIEQLEVERDAELQALEVRHAEEREELAQRTAQWKPEQRTHCTTSKGREPQPQTERETPTVRR